MRPTNKALQFIKGFVRLYKASQNPNLTVKELQFEATLFRETILNLGVTYIKFGQMLSLRYDLFPATVCESLQELLDSEPPLTIDYVKKYLEDHLEQESFKQIRSLEEVPLGSASLGQVHKAYLHTGEIVAIKVQRPDLLKTLKADIKALKKIIGLFSGLPVLKKFSLSEFVSEFGYWTIRELDYTLEAENIHQFRDNFKEDARITAPEVYW